MATVTGFTAARMQAIEDSTVVDGEIDSYGDLILKTRDNSIINAGQARGATGQPWPELTGAADPNINWNTLTTIGVYPQYLQGNNNGPISGHSFVLQVVGGSLSGGLPLAQIAYDMSATADQPNAYMRSNDGASWQPWRAMGPSTSFMDPYKDLPPQQVTHQSYTTYSNTFSVNSWHRNTQIPGITFTVSRPLDIDIDFFSMAVGSATNYSMLGVKLNGDTLLEPNAHNGPEAHMTNQFGAHTPYTPYNGLNTPVMGWKQVRINPGTTEIYMCSLRNVAGNATQNYSTLKCKPVKWAD